MFFLKNFLFYHLFYVITFDPIGFVIVSADDRSKPVLAYSFNNSYENDNIPPHYDYWLGYYADQIEYIIIEDVPKTNDRANEWRDYLNPNPNRLSTWLSRPTE